MAEHGRISVILNGNKLKTVNRVFVGQGIFDHHDFEVSVPMETLAKVHEDEDPFPALKDAVGKDVEITFGVASSDDAEGQNESSVFKGIVRDVSVLGNDWKHAHVLLRGHSPTILIDGIENTQGFSEQGLGDIYDSCVSKHLSSKISKSDNLTYTDKLKYTVQYEETDFNFMKRLCYSYGEWFYYDGENLNLGLASGGAAVNLKKNRVRDLQFDYSVTPGVAGVRYRDYKKHESAELTPDSVKFSDDMAKYGLSESDNLFPAESAAFEPLPSFASGDGLQNEEKELKHLLASKKEAKSAKVLMVTGETDNAALKVGGSLKLEGFHHSGEFVIIRLNHTCLDAKSYSNRFTAIPKDTSYPYRVDVSRPNIKSCIATVSDNMDPNKWGRVRVNFDWSPDVDSPWIRGITPHAGDKRGMYFVPEIGDEVMVGFEYGNPDSPYIIGSLFNGKNFHEEAYDGDNNFKVIRTKSGNEIFFDDTGKLILKNENNTIEMLCDGDGTIAIKTNGNIEVSAGKNIEMEAAENISFTAGKNFSIEVGKDYSVKVDGKGEVKVSKDLALSASSNLEAKATKNLTLSGGQNGKLSAMKTKVEGSATAELTASASTTVKGGIVKIN